MHGALSELHDMHVSHNTASMTLHNCLQKIETEQWPPNNTQIWMEWRYRAGERRMKLF